MSFVKRKGECRYKAKSTLKQMQREPQVAENSVIAFSKTSKLFCNPDFLSLSQHRKNGDVLALNQGEDVNVCVTSTY